MRKLTKRISLAAASAAVAGGAVLGAGGTASAVTPVSAHVQPSAVSVKADDSRWHHNVAYRHNHEENYYCWGDYGNRHYYDPQYSDCYNHWYRYDRHGHFYRWDDEDRDWKRIWNYRDDWNGSHHDWSRGR
ncbi:hypothetical protein [Streptomyces sp. NPDC005262]|uniref:hypothetical protein n=1 Tax=Streptomyces sp. NPDC005262 TaxID=3364710 RepID=UPI00368751D6